MASPASALSADLQAELVGEADRYDGIILDADALPSDPAEFSARLEHSLMVGHACKALLWAVSWINGTPLFNYYVSGQKWKRQSRKGIWLKVPISKVTLVEPAVQQGFIFHHAEPGYVQLCRWLPSTPSKLPANASHQVISPSGAAHDMPCLACAACPEPCIGQNMARDQTG